MLKITAYKAEVIAHLRNNPDIFAYIFARPNGNIMTYNIGNLAFESDILSDEDVAEINELFPDRIVDLAITGHQVAKLDLRALSDLVLANLKIPSTSEYLDRDYHQDDSFYVNNDASSWVSLLNKTFQASHTAEYKISINYSWAYGSSTTSFMAEFLINDDVKRYHTQEPKEVNGTSVLGSGTDQAHKASMVYIANFTKGDSYELSFHFAPEQNNVTASVYNFTATIERWV